MSKTNRLTWLTLGIIATAALAAVAAWLAVASPVTAGAHVVTIAPGESTTVSVNSSVAVGSIDATVSYDTALLNATDCTPNAGWDISDCVIDSAAGSVSLLFADVDGITGSLADITFMDVGGDGTSSDLTLAVAIVTDPLEAPIAASSVSLSATTITVVAPTPEPTPEPTETPTAEPTPPAALPDTGGMPSDGGSTGLALLVAIAGAIALMTVGGGLWITQRTRSGR